jgi:hypothetical protein
MSPVLAFTIGAAVGAGITVYALAWLMTLTATDYPPEVVERIRERAEKARWN